MRITFRQGLISFQTDTGTPVYLVPSITPGFITHAVSPTPTLVAVAHGESDYLLKFDDTTANAWGPITPAATNHLYWDIDVLTTAVTRGITLVEPIYSLSEPATPVNDQHWFDLTNKLMKVWSASKNKWLEKIRVFAGRVLHGNVNTIAMYSAGSQAGLVGPANPGYILLDSMLRPLRKASQNGEFLTDDDEARILSTVGSSGVLVSPVNKVIPVRAGESIPRMSLVYFSADDTVRLASSNPALIPGRPPVGVMIDAVVGGEVGTLVQSGEISYDQWNFSGQAGKPVYCDSFGQITLTRPAGLMAFRVGFVKNPTTILFNVDSETNPQVYTATTEQIIITGQTPVQVQDELNGIGERVVTIAVPDSSSVQSGLMTAGQFMDLLNHGDRLTVNEGAITTLQISKSNVGHGHSIAEVSLLQDALDGKANVAHNHDLTYAAINHNHDLAYAPISHTHVISDVFNLQPALDLKAFRAHLNSFTEVYQTVDRSGTSDVGVGDTLLTALTGKSNIGHGHVISDVTLLQDALDGKAPTVHAHAISDITDLQTTLNGKAESVHTHAISDVTGLQLALDDKADVGHLHALSGLTDVDVTTTAPVANNALVFNGVAWVPGTVSGGGGSGTTLETSFTTVQVDPEVRQLFNFETFTPLNDPADPWANSVPSGANIANPPVSGATIGWMNTSFLGQGLRFAGETDPLNFPVPAPSQAWTAEFWLERPPSYYGYTWVPGENRVMTINAGTAQQITFDIFENNGLNGTPEDSNTFTIRVFLGAPGFGFDINIQNALYFDDVTGTVAPHHIMLQISTVTELCQLYYNGRLIGGNNYVLDALVLGENDLMNWVAQIGIAGTTPVNSANVLFDNYRLTSKIFYDAGNFPLQSVSPAGLRYVNVPVAAAVTESITFADGLIGSVISGTGTPLDPAAIHITTDAPRLLGALDDVSVFGAAQDNVLKFDGVEWVASAFLLGDIGDVQFGYPPLENEVLTYVELDEYGIPLPAGQGVWVSKPIPPKPPFVKAFGAAQLGTFGEQVVIPPASTGFGYSPFPALNVLAYPQNSQPDYIGSIQWTYEAQVDPGTAGSSFLSMPLNGYFQINLRSRILIQYSDFNAVSSGALMITARNYDGRLIGTAIVTDGNTTAERSALFGFNDRFEYTLNVCWNHWTPGVNQTTAYFDVVVFEVRNAMSASVGTMTVTMIDSEVGVTQLAVDGAPVPIDGGLVDGGLVD